MSNVTTVNGVDYSVEGEVAEIDKSEVYSDIYITNTYKKVRHSMYLIEEVRKAYVAGYARGVDEVG